MCAGEALGKIGVAELFGADGAAARGRVDKFAVADIKAHMRIWVAAAGVEKHQIAGFQTGGRNAARGGGHIAGGARQAHAQCVLIHILNHAAAIKAGGAAAAAVFIRCADQAHAVQHQFLRALLLLDVADTHRPHLAGFGLHRRLGFGCAFAAATCRKAKCGSGYKEGKEWFH